jgi:hypothetical protein
MQRDGTQTGLSGALHMSKGETVQCILKNLNGMKLEIKKISRDKRIRKT